MVPPNNLGPDLSGKAINETQYRGMIGSLMYLTASRLDIQFSTCLCARYQANPKESHFIVVKRIFRKSTSGACQLLGGKLMCWSAKKDHILKRDIELHFIPTQYQLADIFSKPLDEPTFKILIIELEEHVTLDKSESLNPFLPTSQVEFSFDEIAITTNNEVALLYPLHPNSEYFREVRDFISKCCLKEAFTRASTQYIEYLCEFWYTTKTLDDSQIWVSTPTGGIRGDIGYNEEIRAKGTLKRGFLPPRRRLLMGHIIQCLDGKTGGLDQISNKDATILYCLANRVKVDYAKLIWEDIIHKLNKKTREKVVLYLRFISLLLEYKMPEYDNEEITINPT
ncbi:hypothetical protein Tco_1562294 [Tanacetum coccineum]